MLERLTSAMFAPLVGDAFRAEVAGGEAFELVLSSCEETRYGSPEVRENGVHRVPFSLEFHAADGRLVDQQIVVLRHEGLGEIPLFIVPLGPDDRGMRYEAVIS